MKDVHAAHRDDTYSFCEPTCATGTAPLCCAANERFTGWDLNVPLTQHHFTHSCSGCVAALARRVPLTDFPKR